MKHQRKNKIYSIIISILLPGLFFSTINLDSTAKSIINPDNEAHVDKIFRDDFNGNTIDTSTWQIATWPEQGGMASAERCYVKNGYLNLVFIYKPGASPYKYLCSAIQTRKEFLFGKWEARLKTSNVSGVLNSMFTIDWDNTQTGRSGSDGTKQEIDIEFLTKYKTKVHYAVHASGRKSFETNPDIDTVNHSADFHVYAINITPDYIEWSVDGKIMKKYIYSKGDIRITSPYQLKLNSWSSTNWIEGPPVADTECIYQIDWIQFTPYSAKKKRD